MPKHQTEFDEEGVPIPKPRIIDPHEVTQMVKNRRIPGRMIQQPVSEPDVPLKKASTREKVSLVAANAMGMADGLGLGSKALKEAGEEPLRPARLASPPVAEQYMAGILEARVRGRHALENAGVTPEYVALLLAEATRATRRIVGKEFDVEVPDWKTRLDAAKFSADILGISPAAMALEFKVEAHVGQSAPTNKKSLARLRSGVAAIRSHAQERNRELQSAKTSVFGSAPMGLVMKLNDTQRINYLEAMREFKAGIRKVEPNVEDYLVEDVQITTLEPEP